VLLCCLCQKLIAQEYNSISLINKDREPVSYAVAITKDTIVFSNLLGQLVFKNKPQQIEIHADRYKSVQLSRFRSQIFMAELVKPKKDADDIMADFAGKFFENNAFLQLNQLNFTRYNRTLIKRDSVDYSVSNENLFSERISIFEYRDNKEKELILAQKNQGFDKPVVKILSHRMHGDNWYNRDYVIFESDYVSPLYPNNFRAYNYQLIAENDDFYFIKFNPKLYNKEKLLEGIFCLDKNFALSNIYASKKEDIKLELNQTFLKHPEFGLWLTNQVLVKMTPGKGGKPVSLFGTNINIGTLQQKSIAESDFNNELYSKSIFYDYVLKRNLLDTKSYDIFVELEAHEHGNQYWKTERKIPLTSADSVFFKGTKSTIEQKNTLSKIKRLQNVNNGFFPILKWKTDLKTLIKINNYEGLRLGIGGLTNEDFSENFRIGGYIAYGTKDKTIKYGIDTGFLLDRDTNTWLNGHYTDDVREVGSNAYLTDERVYSLFEPRLVNIIFFYKEKTASLSIQKKITPKLLSEFKVAHDRIFQTQNYAYLNGDIAIQSYDLSRAVLSLRWSPRSRFLKFDNNFINVNEKYPILSGQIEQFFGNTFCGDLTFTKLSLKSDYIINHINNHSTEFALEGNIAFGQVPLTHSYHAYPNAPNKPSILDRFSVAGVKSFETMFFSEFFSTRLASLHIKHRFSPFKISNKLRPELVLISRHAIGDFSNQNRHIGIDFNTLEKGYSEAGLELNKIFWGFGLSFAYRYGAYHLPVFEDNIAFKFTFNLKL
jgi:hypothetical protein